ncbi:MAG: DUF6261 family protein [Tannerellaceae bacterium]|jgi:molybdopterin converting factor small subunit|nr:DUF6261 family protein [Tannerellaceae bacterium]
MGRITKFLDLTEKMSVAQAVEYFTLQRERLATPTAKVPLLAIPWKAFGDTVTTLTNVYKRPGALPQTPEVVQLELKRDREFMFIFTFVKNIREHSDFDDEIKAADVIWPVLANHAGLSKMEYEAETAAIKDVTEKLQGPTCALHVTNLNLSRHVNQLEQFNNDFSAKYVSRLDQKYANKKTGTASAWRREAAAALNVFLDGVNSLRGMLTDASQLAATDEIITLANAVTAQYVTIVNRHLGLTATKDDDTQKPDVSNPPPPGGNGGGETPPGGGIG